MTDLKSAMAELEAGVEEQEEEERALLARMVESVRGLREVGQGLQEQQLGELPTVIVELD